MSTCPTLHMDEAGGLHTAHAVLSPAHVGPTVLSGDRPSLQRAAPILLRHAVCGRDPEVPREPSQGSPSRC